VEDARDQPLHSLLCRAPLWRRRRRRNADGAAAHRISTRDRRSQRPRQGGAALSHSALWRLRRSGRRHGQELRLSDMSGKSDVTHLRFSSMAALAVLLVMTSGAALAQSRPEAQDMRLVGYSDLQGRSAYQPTIHQQDGRWIAYIGHHGGTDAEAARFNP